MIRDRIGALIIISYLVINYIFIVGAFGTAASTSIIYSPISNEPLAEITAESDNSENFYINNPILVSVRIMDGNYKSILIKERIDDNFELLNFSSHVESSEIYFSQAKMNHEINKNVISIRIDRLSSSKTKLFSYVYKYSLIPKNSGAFKNTFAMRYIDSAEKTPDLQKTLNLDILPPDPNFEVSIKYSENLEASIGDKLDLHYIITYKGGYTDPANFELIFDNDTKALIPKYTSLNKTFMVNRPTLIPYQIECIEEGTYFIPGLWIGEKYYPIYQTITIVSLFNKYKDDLYNILSIILQLLALGIPIILVIRRELEKIYSEVKEIRELIKLEHKERHCCIDKKDLKL